jgi:N-acetylneuraminate epimerase
MTFASRVSPDEVAVFALRKLRPRSSGRNGRTGRVVVPKRCAAARGAGFRSAKTTTNPGRRIFLNFASLLTLHFMLVVSSLAASATLNWKQLAPIPDPVGFAAPFAGVSDGALIVAGGANFPGALPWEGGKKFWYDSIYVLSKPDGEWQAGFKLPRPLGYGVSVSTRAGVVCAGGSDANQHYRDVFRLSWRDGKVETEMLPSLPLPMANGCGALTGNTFYLAGGTERPDSTNALNAFWALDLAPVTPQWRELPPWPGSARMLAVAGADANSFFLFGGVEMSGDAHGKPVRRHLRDAYRFTPGQGWKRLADLPRAAVAAPSPAIARDGKLLIVSGDDGANVNFEPKSAHPGFPKDVLAYDPATDAWSHLGDSPLSRATVPTVEWNDLAVIPNGEVRPGRRTPEVWGLKLR